MNPFKKLFVSALTLCTVLISAASLEGSIEIQDQNQQKVLQLFQTVTNKPNHENLYEIFSENCLIHAFQQDFDLEFGKEFDRTIFSAFDVEKIEVHDCFSRDDRVLIQWTFHLKQIEEYLGVPAANQKPLVSGFSIYRFSNGKIVELWQYWDRLGMYNQIGIN